MTGSYHYPNISQSVWILVLVLAVMFVLGVFFGILESAFKFPMSTHPAAFALINLIAIGLAAIGIWLLIRQFRKSGDTVPEDVSGDRSDQL